MYSKLDEQSVSPQEAQSGESRESRDPYLKWEK